MPGCCGILTFSVAELVTILAGLVALSTNNWIYPQSATTQCLLGVQSAGLWTVCPGSGVAAESCREILNGEGAGDELTAEQAGQQIADQITNITEISQASSWIFTSNDVCTPLKDQSKVLEYYGSLPQGAADAQDYTLYLNSLRGLVCIFTALGFINIITVASHRPGNAAASGCGHFFKAMQVAAGICAIGVFVGMLTNIASKDDFDVKEFGLSIEKGWGSVSSMWGWSWWLFVGAVAWAIVTWIVMCFAFCCGGRREKY